MALALTPASLSSQLNPERGAKVPLLHNMEIPMLDDILGAAALFVGLALAFWLAHGLGY